MCGGIIPNWRIICLDQSVDLQQATILAAKIPEGAGLVSQQNCLALRVPKGAFGNAWKTLFLATPQPEDIDTFGVYKVECLPYGVTSKMLSAWSTHYSWKAKPLRAMGPRAWLLGTSQEPSGVTMHFNGSPVLIRELKARMQNPSNPIIAGPKPTMQPTSTGANIGPLLTDQWANYTGPKPSPSASNGAGNAAVASIPNMCWVPPTC